MRLQTSMSTLFAMNFNTEFVRGMTVVSTAVIIISIPCRFSTAHTAVRVQHTITAGVVLRILRILEGLRNGYRAGL